MPHWTAICARGDSFAVARQDGTWLRVTSGMTDLLWAKDVGDVSYHTMAADDSGQVAVAFTKPIGTTDVVQFVKSGGEPKDCGGIGTMRPIRLRWAQHEGVFRFVLGIARKHGLWDAIDPETGELLRHDVDKDWSTAGVTDMTDDLRGVWAIPASIPGKPPAQVTVAGVPIYFPVTRGAWQAGQGDTPESLLLARHGEVGQAFIGPAREVDLVVLPDGRAVTCARFASESSPRHDVRMFAAVPGYEARFDRVSYPTGVGLFGDVAPLPQIIGVTEPVTATTRAVFHTLGQGSLTASLAKAKDAGVPCLIWKDKPGLKPSDVPDGARGLLYGYPTSGWSVDKTISLFRDEADAFRDAGKPWDVGFAAYRQRTLTGYSLSEPHVKAVNTALWDTAHKISTPQNRPAFWGFAVANSAWFSGGELVDGTKFFPGLARMVDQMRAASSDWKTFPKPAAAPQPEPTPEPDEDDDDMPAPTLHEWITQEFPRVLQAWRYGQATPSLDPNPGDPGAKWAAFQTVRRYGEYLPPHVMNGETWSVEQMIAHELSHRPAGLPAPPPF